MLAKNDHAFTSLQISCLWSLYWPPGGGGGGVKEAGELLLKQRCSY